MADILFKPGHLLFLCMLGTLMHFFTCSTAQAQDQSGRWDIFIDNSYTSTITEESPDPDSLHAMIRQLIRQQQLLGYYLVRLDSIRVNNALSERNGSVYLGNGPLVRVQHLSLKGAHAIEQPELFEIIDTAEGDVLNPAMLSADIDRIIDVYEERGYHFAKVSIDELQVVEDTPGEPGVTVSLLIDEGSKVKINDLMLLNARRTKRTYLEYLLGIQPGTYLLKDLDELQSALEASQLFEQVYPLDLIHVGGEEYIVVVPVEESQPGAFDLVLGYQPPGGSGQNNGLVGNGHLDLRNPFGMGRRISLRLNRLPGQVSSVDARYADPFFFGTAFSIEGGFVGLQQDSTYSQQSLQAALGYRFLEGLETFATVKREITRPGQSGLQFLRNMQRVPRSEVTFWGFSVRYSSVDRPSNPRSGIYIETAMEGGRKQRSAFERSVEGDTTTVTTRTRQQRLEARFRGYIPVFTRQVVAIGNDSRIIASEEFDISDLYRIGGAQSLRGYDEDRFRGRLVSRALIEWRYLFERTSYAYIFFDLGYVDRPATTDFDADKSLFPGYGLGMQFETGIGLINTSLALSSSDAPSQAKVHVGVSLGL